MRVFVSYRREDSRAYAGRLHDALTAEFGESRIFQDVSAIGPGEDFVEAIDAALDTADAVLVVIGPSWMAPGPDGVSRLNDPGDYVRIETARALQADIKVVPVLVGGGSLPPADDLPEDLVPLTHRQAAELRDDVWQADVNRLIGALRGEDGSSRSTRRWLGVAGVGVALAMAAGLLFLLGDGDPPGDSSSVTCASPSEPTWTPIVGPNAELSGTIEDSSGKTEVIVTGASYRRLDDTEEWEVIVVTRINNETSEEIYNDYWNYRQLDVNRLSFEEKSCFFSTHPLVGVGNSSNARVGYVVTEDPSGSVRLVVQSADALVTIDLGS